MSQVIKRQLCSLISSPLSCSLPLFIPIHFPTSELSDLQLTALFLLLPFFRLHPGETKTTVSPYIPGGVSDGQWHSVQLHYYNKVRN